MVTLHVRVLAWSLLFRQRIWVAIHRNMQNQQFAGASKTNTSFLAPLERRLAAVVIPRIPAWLETHHLTMLTLVWSLLIGAALRGGAELVGGYSPGWSSLEALGGTLAVVAFIAFAIGLWRSTVPAPAPAPPGR